jgi:hypothetical protein
MEVILPAASARPANGTGRSARAAWLTKTMALGAAAVEFADRGLKKSNAKQISRG